VRRKGRRREGTIAIKEGRRDAPIFLSSEKRRSLANQRYKGREGKKPLFLLWKKGSAFSNKNRSRKKGRKKRVVIPLGSTEKRRKLLPYAIGRGQKRPAEEIKRGTPLQLWRKEDSSLPPKNVDMLDPQRKMEEWTLFEG